MGKLSSPIEHDGVVAAAEIEAVSNTPTIGLSQDLYFEDLILHHYEEKQTADCLLKAAEDEYYPLQPLTPTEYYDNNLNYASDGDSDFVRLAEEEQRDGLLLSGSLSPTLYYETTKSASVNKPATAQAHDSILGQQPPFVEGSAPTRMTGDEGNWMITNIVVEHHGDECIDLHSNGGLSEDQQERVYKPVAATNSQGSSETLVSEDSSIVLRPSGENKDTFSRIVELVIDGKKAIVHEHLLCEISGFFERSSRHNTSETPLSFSVRDYVSDIDWDTLMVFVKWVYFNELYDKVGLGEDPPNWDELLDLYLIADKWEIIVLKNLLVDVLAGQFEEGYDFPCYGTKKIWSNTAPGASLRRLWVDFYKFGISETEFRDEMKSDALDLDFMKELSLSLIIDSREVGLDSDNTPHFIDPSIYHVADDVTGTCCCRVRFEGHEYTHKIQYKRARDHQRRRRRIHNLEGEVKLSEENAESPQLTLVAKEKSLLDKEEYKNWDSKAKELEDQLAKLRESKLKSEPSKNKRIKHLETSHEDTQNLLTASNASKDRDVSTVETIRKAVEDKSQAKNKEVQNQKHEIAIANAKKRKADSDWRSG